ncbi:hypothetical protein OH77DRAFT_1501023 [Trametes cingulata]|nr:hypothetical protein OH77DRAFT_1501023 [Trametes cingulata]
MAGMFHDVQPSDPDEPDAVRAQKEDDMLRAAVQLPNKWPDILQVLCSEYASPAATRLAFTLVWGMNVMASGLAYDAAVEPMRAGDDLLSILQRRVKQLSNKRDQASHLLIDVGEQERITYAMLVSMFAVADTFETSTNSPCMPQSHGTLLELIENVLSTNGTSQARRSVSPVTELDVAQTILVKWGHVLPWSWRVWDDTRLYNSDVAECLTATWLHHLDASVVDIVDGHSVEWWDDDLAAALESNPSAALSMMSRLVTCALSTARELTSRALGAPVLDVVLKACWSIKHVLQATPVHGAALPPLYSVMYRLFLLLGDDGLELAIKDLLLEGLSFSPSSLHSAIDITDDPRSEYTLAWDRSRFFAYCSQPPLPHELRSSALRRTRSSLKTGRIRDNASESELRHCRQALQMLTLVWRAGRTPRTLSDPARLLLSAVLSRLESEALDSPTWTMLGDAAIGALAIWHEYGEASAAKLGGQFIWDVMDEMDPGNLPLAASISAYIAATAHTRSRDALACFEAWNYCRDVALLILNRDFGGAGEPLALLVFPVICRALAALAQHAPPAAMRYYVASPWTMCMIDHMKRLKYGEEDDDDYTRILQELSGPNVQRLCSLLSIAGRTQVHEEQEHDAEKRCPQIELTFCWNQSRACLIPA